MGDFTQDAENIIQRAKEEARNRNSFNVDDTDILLAMLKHTEEMPIIALLRRAGISYSKVLDEARRRYDQYYIFYGDAPWTNSAQNVLNNARSIARKYYYSCCETKYLFAGLLMTNGTATKILSGLGFRLRPENILLQLSTTNCEQTAEQKVRTHIRWMIRRDMPEVLQIEIESFEFPWLEDDFIRCLRQRNCIGMVAEVDDRVAGFMIYELHKSRIYVLNFAVAPDLRRHSIGSQMVAKLIGKLSLQRRIGIVLEVRETNLGAQLFFRENGFRAVSVLRDYYADTPEDAYLMRCSYKPKIQQPLESIEGNKIARLAG